METKYIHQLTVFFPLLCFSITAQAQDTLGLQKAIEIGLQNNFSIIIARNTEEIAKNNNTLGNAGFLPQLNLNYNNTHGINNSKATFAAGGSREGNGVKTSNTTANALVNWTIFDGFNMFTTKSKLEELQKYGEIQTRMNIENTVSEIINNYYAIVQQQKLSTVIEEAINLSVQRLKLAQVKLSIGSTSEQGMLQAMVDANTDSTNLIMQIGLIKNSKSDLNRLLGRDVNVPFEVNNEIEINESIQLQSILEKMNDQNAQLQMTRSSLNVARYAINGYKSQYLPTVGLFGGYNYLKSINPISPAPINQSNGLTYGLTATFNIFNGGVTSLNLQNAKILMKSSQLQYEDTRLTLQNNINKIYNDYKTNLKIISIQKLNVGIARKDVNIALGRFKLGDITDIDLRVTQQKLIDAENSLLNAQFTVKQSEVEMQRMSGELLNVK